MRTDLLRRLLVLCGALAIFTAVAVLLIADPLGLRPQTCSGPCLLAEALPRSQRVTEQSNLRVSFGEPMDRQSVEAHLVLPEGGTFTSVWESDDILALHSAEALRIGDVHTVTVRRGALRNNGVPLEDDLAFTFIVAGAPAVVARMPEPNSMEVVASEATITMVFDRPMVALSALEDDAGRALTEQLSIDPPVPGHWRWLGTSAVEYAFSRPLDPATRYAVHVPAGLPSLSGDLTAADFTWSFQTALPAFLYSESNPGPGAQNIGPKPVFRLAFNQEIDLASVAKQLRLERLDDGKRVAVQLGLAAFARDPVDGDAKKTVENKAAVTVSPAEPLAMNARHELVLDAGFRAARGPLIAATGAVIPFNTAGPFSVLGMTYEYGGLTLRFSTPVTSESLTGAVLIAPEPSGWKSIAFSPNSWENDMATTAYPVFAPSTTYTVTIPAGTQDAFGQKLAAPFTASFTTPDLSPSVSVRSRGIFGIFEREKPPIYYMNGINVSRYQFKAARLTLGEFLALRNQYRWDYAAAPSLAEYADYHAWEVKHEAKKNESQRVVVDVAQHMGGALKPGMYAMTVQAPEYIEEWGSRRPIVSPQFFSVTNLSVALKYSASQALVWVIDLRTGEPVRNATVRFHKLDGTEVKSGKTDDDGLLATDISLPSLAMSGDDWETEFWVTAEKDDDVAFVSSTWMDGLRSYDFGMPDGFRTVGSSPSDLLSFVYTDRPAYRPGDEVHYKGILRMRDSAGRLLPPPADRTVHVSIHDAQDMEVQTVTLPLSPLGAFAGTFPSAPDGALGSYSIIANLVPDSDVGGQSAWGSFSVLAYKKPEYKVDVTLDKTEYVAGDTVKGSVAGAYYFGMPMQGAAVAWRATSADYYFNKFTDGWYSFAPDDVWCWMDCSSGGELLTEGHGTLDARGELAFSLPTKLNDKKISQIMTLEADITEFTGQVVSGRTETLIHKADAYVGLRSEDYAVAPGGDARLSIVTLTPSGDPLPGKHVTLSLSSRTWTSVRTKGVDGEYYYENDTKDTFIRSFSAQTDGQGKAVVTVRIPSGGEFRIVAEVQDDAGRKAQAGVGVYAWSSDYVYWPRTNNDRIEVLTDKRSYEVGDTATLLVQSPFQGDGVKALVTVEREGITSSRIVDVTSTALPLKVEITPDMAPNAFVSVLIVKPRIGETFDEDNRDTGLPAFKLGYAQLHISAEQHRVQVNITTDKDRYAPGDEVKVALRTLDSEGKPVAADVSLSAVDASVLALTGFKLPDPLATFFAERGLGVRTAHALLYILERFKPGSKGGGGGEPPSDVRGTFRDTAFWSPSITTDRDGNATASFRLPDNLTTWNLIAIAQTRDNGFGAAEHQVLSTKDVLLRPLRPRFAVDGDRFELGAVVRNDLTSAQDFTVTLSVSGATIDGADQQYVRLAAGEQRSVTFPVTIGHGDKVTYTLRAAAANGGDAVQESFPVYAFGTPQTVANDGVVTDAFVEEQVVIPAAKDAANVAMKLTLSPSLGSALPGGLEYVLHFPYGCAEQTTSSFLPNVAVSRLQGYDAFRIVSDSVLQERVTAGLSRLYTFQRGDGGFGYWQNSDQSYVYLSAYVLEAMAEAKAAGYAVDATVMENTRAYLRTSLREQRTSALDSASRAYVLFVLGETGEVNTSLLSNLYDRRGELPLFAKAYLAMAYQRSAGAASSPRAHTLIEDILTQAKTDARGVHFEEQNERYYAWLMQTNDRTTAIVLRAMTRITPGHVLLPDIVRGMLASRRDGHWETTQSTAQTILALVEYLDVTGELDASFNGTATIDGTAVASMTMGKDAPLLPTVVRLAGEALAPGKHVMRVAKDSANGRLYYEQELSYVWTSDTLPAREEGIGIHRDVEPVQGASKDLRVGDLYRVTVTLTVPENRYFVAVESPLPAGMEPVDLSLATSQQELLQDTVHATNSLWPRWWGDWFSHVEFRDDRVFLFADSLSPGVYRYQYLMRGAVPGAYRVRPARVWEMYYPEVFGQTAGERVEVKP